MTRPSYFIASLVIGFMLFVGLVFSYSISDQAAAQNPANAASKSISTSQLEIETGRMKQGVIELVGTNAQQQLIITAHPTAGTTIDVTREVKYTVTPKNIVAVSSSGLVSSLSDGQGTIIASHPKFGSVKAPIVVKSAKVDLPVNFPNEVVPIFTKLGCNSGGCHGKSGGQNGFALSLLGFEPTEDYEHLVKEARGRRIFPAAPERSLLLLKSISALPHGGGQKLTKESPGYQIILRWIQQGTPYGNDDDPKVVRIEMLPKVRMMKPKTTQQVVVVAHYSDGSTRDVTGMTKYDPNDSEMAEVEPSGLVKVKDLTGDVGIMARYQGFVDVYRATIPLGAPVKNLPKPANFIDELVFQKLVKLGMPPSANCDDATFIRRVTLDVAGRLPTLAECKTFLADKNSDKRAKLIDRLLASTDYADNFANKWSAILRNRRTKTSEKRGSYLFHGWIREQLHKNTPYDQFVRDIIAASGEVGENPPVVWYRQVKSKNQQMEDTAQLFLGMRIQCARCHHHPFEKWSQQDYYGFEAYFSRIGRKKGLQQDEDRIYHQRGIASSKNIKTGENVKPKGLGAELVEIAADEDPRHALVDWMSQKDNQFFAPALVNRYWKHFFDRGLVEPEDDMRVTNPPSNPELLSALAKHFIEHKFDMKDLVRTICNSKAYQLSSIPNQYNARDKKNYSRYYPRRLRAEVLLDAIDDVTKVKTKFDNMPLAVRALQLPDNNFNSYFLSVFGRPENSSACECERSAEANLAQSLHLLNSSSLQSKISSNNGRTTQLLKDKSRSTREKIDELFYLFFARSAKSNELSVAEKYLAKAKDDSARKLALEDIIWALMNTKEFQFNH